MATAAYYPVNDTSLSAAERGYLQQLQDAAATQNLDEDLRPEVRDLSIAFTVLACFVVGLRFLARHLQRAPIGIDDWMILVSLTFLGGNLAFNIVMIGQGLGLHSGRVTLEQLQALNETVVGAEIVYTTAVNTYKIALLFLYFRIFPLPVIRKWGYVCGGISTAWNLACIFAAAFQCQPRIKIWEPWVDGYCIDLFLTQLCVSVPSILCDIAILCLPLPHILRLKTNLTQKIFLVAIFMLGSYVVFTSIYRFVIYLSYTHEDIPFSLAIPCAWNVIEISSGIISSCLPTLGPIIRPILKSVMPSSLGASSGHKSYGKRVGGSADPGLVTIGGGNRRSKGKWSQFDTPGGGSRSRRRDADLDDVDIEMGPRTTVTANTHAARGSPDSSAGGSDGIRGTVSRDSDDYPIMGGINKTTQVEWTVEEVRNQKR